jgi:hypothetical protein
LFAIRELKRFYYKRAEGAGVKIRQITQTKQKRAVAHDIHACIVMRTSAEREVAENGEDHEAHGLERAEEGGWGMGFNCLFTC